MEQAGAETQSLPNDLGLRLVLKCICISGIKVGVFVRRWLMIQTAVLIIRENYF